MSDQPEQSLRDKVAFAIVEAFPWPGELEQEMADQMADALIERGLVVDPIYVSVEEGIQREGEERVTPRVHWTREEFDGKVRGKRFHRRKVGYPRETFGPWKPGRA